ncbi:E3 SUMO-protein ligase PIAS1 [Striga asiatica]|uniref:E3 SUMO-protein ligase PIAS1 n=1 Tax=Striga asiatica TaxID=4170 RepID=A0A5A7Q6K4_STRAF|nr:E3 SUMO-protein ligase PIAS1 [Striga asiatica]
MGAGCWSRTGARRARDTRMWAQAQSACWDFGRHVGLCASRVSYVEADWALFKREKSSSRHLLRFSFPITSSVATLATPRSPSPARATNAVNQRERPFFDGHFPPTVHTSRPSSPVNYSSMLRFSGELPQDVVFRPDLRRVLLHDQRSSLFRRVFPPPSSSHHDQLSSGVNDHHRAPPPRHHLRPPLSPTSPPPSSPARKLMNFKSRRTSAFQLKRLSAFQVKKSPIYNCDKPPPHVANHPRFRLVKSKSTEPRDCRSPARRSLESAPEHDMSVDIPPFVLDSYWKNSRPIHKCKVKLGMENGELERRIGN